MESGGKNKFGRSAVALAATSFFLTLGVLSSAQSQSKEWSESTPALGKLSAMPSGHLSIEKLNELTEIGRQLFIAKFTIEDGAGRPAATQAIIPTKSRHPAANAFARLSGPDAHACSSCHNDPIVGGAGDFVTNVFVSEGFVNADFDSSDPQFSNERGTNHLFGAGLLELLAREITVDLQQLRKNAILQARQSSSPATIDLVSKGVSYGKLTALPDGIVNLDQIDGVDSDLVIRPFSQKGVMTSLRQFTVNAMNHHHGVQPSERFDSRWTGTDDYDEDNHSVEMTSADVSALVAWQATLPTPTAMAAPSEDWQKAAEIGKAKMAEFGCNACHMEALPLKSLSFADPGPVDAAGTLNDKQVKEPAIYDLALLDWTKDLPRNEKGEILIPLFGDLKRHKMTDNSIEALGNELMAQRFVERNIFMTAELWGVGSTAPYGHRNDFTTLDGIISSHGGDARSARDAYVKASDEDRSSLVAFLKTLVIR